MHDHCRKRLAQFMMADWLLVAVCASVMAGTFFSKVWMQLAFPMLGLLAIGRFGFKRAYREFSALAGAVNIPLIVIVSVVVLGGSRAPWPYAAEKLPIFFLLLALWPIIPKLIAEKSHQCAYGLYAGAILAVMAAAVATAYTWFLWEPVHEISYVNNRNKLNKPFEFIGLLLWPTLALATLCNHQRHAVTLALLLYLVGFASDNQTFLLGMPISLAVFWVSHRMLRQTEIAILILAIVGTLLLPWFVGIIGNDGWAVAALEQHSVSLAERVKLWSCLSGQIPSQVLLGWGMDGSRFYEALSQCGYYHPHNAYLQIWVDLGIVGVAAAIVLFIKMYHHITMIDVQIRPYALAFVTFAMIDLAFSHSVWHTAWICGFLTAWAIVSGTDRALQMIKAQAG